MIQEKPVFYKTCKIKDKPLARKEFPLSKLKPQHFLWLVLGLAALLRLWGLDFGLPNISRPDEQNISYVLIRIFKSFAMGQPDLNPHFFEYPSFHLYLMTGLYGIYYLVGHLMGMFPDLSAFLDHYADDFYPFHLIARYLTALMGIATVWIVYQLGVGLGRSRWLGLFSAFLMAVTYLHVRDSHFGVTDVPATFWVAFSLWMAVLYVRTGQKKHLLLACLATGLGAGTKYPAGLTGLSVLIA